MMCDDGQQQPLHRQLPPFHVHVISLTMKRLRDEHFLSLPQHFLHALQQQLEAHHAALATTRLAGILEQQPVSPLITTA